MFGGVSQFDMTLELSRRRIDSFIVGKKRGRGAEVEVWGKIHAHRVSLVSRKIR